MTAVAGLGLLVWAGVLHVAHVAIAGELRPADGVRLAGTFLPGRSRAAVVLLHGAHDRRADTVAHARLLSRAGFAVLAYDARGHGRSGGRANAFGWRGASDLAGAVAFLRRTPGVDGARIGALGLSMGAETALRAAAAGVPLRAVVADGAGASTVGDQRLTGAGGLELSVLWTGIRLVEALSAEREAAPLRDLAARVRVPALLVASGADGEAAIDRALAARMPRARTWVVPAAAHTRVLQRDPAGYAARVTGFLRSALHTR